MILVLARVITDAAVLYASTVVVITCLSVSVGWTVSRIPGLAVELGRRDAAWFLGVLPFGWAGGLFGATSLDRSLPAIAVPLAILGTGGGALFGIVLVSMSRTRRADAALEETTQSTEWGRGTHNGGDTSLSVCSPWVSSSSSPAPSVDGTLAGGSITPASLQ